jgi:hypothetical protein
MYRLRNAVGPLAGLLIYGSLASYVWLYADYFCHHQYSIWTKFRWVNNPNYHFSWWWFVLAGIALAIGLILEEIRNDNSTLWLMSTGLAKTIEMLAFIFLPLAGVLTFSYYIGYLSYLHAPNWSTFIGPFWQWQMWWAVLIGWSFVAGLFCLLRRSNIVNLCKQFDQAETEANFLAKIPTDILVQELAYRQNQASAKHFRIIENDIQNDRH